MKNCGWIRLVPSCCVLNPARGHYVVKHNPQVVKCTTYFPYKKETAMAQSTREKATSPKKQKIRKSKRGHGVVKAALYTIVPRSPFFVFCAPKYCRLQKRYKMRLGIICFNKMALFGLFAALIKGCSSYGRNGGHPARGEG